jgi:hypothetical protein
MLRRRRRFRRGLRLRRPICSTPKLTEARRGVGQIVSSSAASTPPAYAEPFLGWEKSARRFGLSPLSADRYIGRM